MKKTKLKATSLKSMMVAAIIITIGLAAGGFYFAQDWLSTFAISVGQTIAQSTNGSNTSQGIQNLKEEMAQKQVVAGKASSITISSQDYQSQAISDLNKYAANTGISITKAAPATAESTLPAINGVRINYITITLGSPIPMTSLIQFLKSIETNLPKMQLAGIKVNQVQDSSNNVSVDPLTIEVYTK